ncbi:lambda exonuclease family protein [Burkholderia multivorans]|uniref:lambda exonuclease family protein n=1 Tax=Burkholderia multivorans TaxID=87883 RepID=UPI000CFE940A|nr:lambda exonuclease family protein [Burkholderia multivorans]PRH14338.1 exonuclease [Burkholderia multivorans]
MIIVSCQQGTQEWLDARCGAITASCFADAISVLTRKSGGKEAGDPTGASDKYCYDLAIERVSGKPYGEPVKAWTLERGHALEVEARIEYEAQTGYLASESGVILTDDRRFGYSSDGLVEDDGLIEIKCPVDSVKIIDMLRTGDVSEYYHQIQGGLWISGRKWCDFIQYVPALENGGNHLFIKRIERDEAFIEQMVEKLLAFDARVEEVVALLSKKIA